MRLSKIFLSVILIFSIFTALVPARCRTKPPTRSKFEEIYGKPVDCFPKDNKCFDFREEKMTECPRLPEGTVCYKHIGENLHSIFDADDNLKQLFVSGDNDRISNIARTLIPESWQELWESRKKPPKVPLELTSNNLEKFSDDCIDWEAGRDYDLTTNYIPVWIKIIWK